LEYDLNALDHDGRKAHVPEEGIEAWLEDFYMMARSLKTQMLHLAHVCTVCPMSSIILVSKAKNPLVQFAAIAPFLAESGLQTKSPVGFQLENSPRFGSDAGVLGKDAIPIRLPP